MDWRNGLSLFSRDIREDSSFDLQNNMGVELFRVGRYAEAKKYFETEMECKIEIKLADESQEAKAKSAWPGKVGLLLE